MGYWRSWIDRPRTVRLRQVIFQIHLWTGIAIVLYVLVICLSGSVLVYRSDFERIFTPKPRFVERGAVALSEEQLAAAAQRSLREYLVRRVRRGELPNQAATVELARDDKMRRELFDPYTGEDLGNATPMGFRLTEWLLDFHDNLLSGPTGRRVNGLAGVLVILSCLTGMVVWWPGIQRWRRSMMMDFRSGWQQTTWSLHSAFGFWFVGFVLMWGITGVYLSFHQSLDAIVYYLGPSDESGVWRFGDRVLYWLAYTHFGRFGGRIPGCGRGTCNEIFKAVWATFGISPIIMAITGVIMWWNRSGARALSPIRRKEKAATLVQNRPQAK